MTSRRGEVPRRRYRRLTVRVVVEYTADDGLRTDLATTLGAGGLFIAADPPLAETLPIKVRFRLPGEETLWEIEGRVAWADHTGMGIEFVDRQAIARLARALERWGNGDGP